MTLFTLLLLQAPPSLGGCQILPTNHVFNTPIDTLPVHPRSAAYIQTIRSTPRNLHLDLGSDTDTTSATYYGIPFNLVAGNSVTWQVAPFHSLDPDMSWSAGDESDCADSAHALVRPCTTGNYLPIPPNPKVEGGTQAEAFSVADGAWNYGDHHILMVDTDRCHLWETYHSYYPNGAGGWDIFGAAFFDLRSNTLRPDGWTSADAAGFPILPLLLRADEASTGTISHALRFTLSSSSNTANNKIAGSYVWPARHRTHDDTSTAKPAMGQLFRLKKDFVIPAGYTVQAKAILQALKTYGMYLADGGSDMYITGDPSAAWSDQTITDVQNVTHDQFEAVDLSPITGFAGFDPNSAAVVGFTTGQPPPPPDAPADPTSPSTPAPGAAGTPAASGDETSASTTKQGTTRGCGGGAATAPLLGLSLLGLRRRRVN